MFHIIWATLFIIKLYKSVTNAPKLQIDQPNNIFNRLLRI